MKKYDILKFNYILNNKNVKDIGIIKNIINEDNEIFYQVLPFNLKVYCLYLNKDNVIEKIGEYHNFNFINDESNHQFKINDEFYLQLNDKFFNKFINEFGYYYWDNETEIKNVFKDKDVILCKVKEYWGPNIYHIETNIHDLRLNDKLINEFKL